MKGIVGIAFGAVFLLTVIMGLIYIYTQAEAKPLPNDPIYTNLNSSVNQSTAFIAGFVPISAHILTPFIFILIMLFFLGVVAFAVTQIKRNR